MRMKKRAQINFFKYCATKNIRNIQPLESHIYISIGAINENEYEAVSDMGHFFVTRPDPS